MSLGVTNSMDAILLLNMIDKDPIVKNQEGAKLAHMSILFYEAKSKMAVNMAAKHIFEYIFFSRHATIKCDMSFSRFYGSRNPFLLLPKLHCASLGK